MFIFLRLLSEKLSSSLLFLGSPRTCPTRYDLLLPGGALLMNQEKLAYVDVIIELLELSDIEDAMIGQPGAGLGVEQRKRLTIGVELVSKP
jgi:hypothetical protein